MAGKKNIDEKNFMHFVCHLSVIPVYDKPGLHEKMLTQLLFGELGMITERKNKHWFKIICEWDKSEGWVQSNQIYLISPDKYNKYCTDQSLSLELCHPAMKEQHALPILIGSVLHRFDGMSLDMPDGKYIYNGQAVRFSEFSWSPEIMVKIARKYLFSPYLTSGRNAFGTDASGFIQNVYRFFNIRLPRQLSDQYTLGNIVDFVEQAQEGDIAFFEDKDGNIHHGGIIIDTNTIIHVFGKVRIDKLDHYGIFNKTNKKYTHKLRIIKRILG